jgi:non-specific serine/threonine protein kinase/serine/threonine-protein kinase
MCIRDSTFAYRASKFIRRNAVSVAASALVLMSLFVGLGVSLWQAEEARRERDRAEQRFEDVRKLSNALLFEISPKIEVLEGSTEAREVLVKRALEYLDSLAAESGGNPGLDAELAAAYEKIGELQGHPSKPNLGDLAGALASYEKANAIRLRLSSTLENRRLLAENFRYLADARYWQGDTAGSFAALLESKRLYEELLAGVLDDAALTLAYLKILAELSQYHQANNQYAEAIRLAEAAIAGTYALDQTSRATREVYFVTHADLGNSLSWNGEQERAEREMAKAVAGVKALLAEQPNDARTRHIAWRVLMLASGIYEEINDATSLSFAEKAVATAARGVELDPADIQFQHNLARSNYRMGVVAVNLKQTSRAVASLRRAEQQFLRLIGREPRNRFYQSDLGRIYTRLGLAMRLRNDLDGSNEAFVRSMKLWQQIASTDPANKNARRDIALAQKNLAENYAKLGNAVDARLNFEQAIRILNGLKAENALPEVDNKLIDELQTAVARL